MNFCRRLFCNYRQMTIARVINDNNTDVCVYVRRTLYVYNKKWIMKIIYKKKIIGAR